jgi:Tat protein translocase TatC
MQMPGAFAPIALRPVSHDARMNVVDHLEELRTRLIVSLATVAVASGLCFWQNHQLLRLVNAPLAQNTQELTVTLIFALILSLPVLLLQTYGFLMPAFDPLQQRRMLPVTLSIPILFAVGVAFGYLVVLPASLHFFQNFNSDQFNVLVQASQYYTFAATILLAMGLLFQVPVAIIAATRAGLITPRQLRRHRRWAVLACCAVAAIIPGDVITMLLETVPPYLLFELSVLIAAWSERRAARRAARAAAPVGRNP